MLCSQLFPLIEKATILPSGRAIHWTWQSITMSYKALSRLVYNPVAVLYTLDMTKYHQVLQSIEWVSILPCGRACSTADIAKYFSSSSA